MFGGPWLRGLLADATAIRPVGDFAIANQLKICYNVDGGLFTGYPVKREYHEWANLAPSRRKVSVLRMTRSLFSRNEVFYCCPLIRSEMHLTPQKTSASQIHILLWPETWCRNLDFLVGYYTMCIQ
jgi:hypothetical protein